MLTGRSIVLAAAGLLAPFAESSASIDPGPPTVETLAGIWLNEDWDALLLALHSDGTMAFDNGGYLDTDPAVAGTFALDQHDVVFTAGESACAAGDSWTFEATTPEDGRLLTVITEDGTGNCSVGMGTEWSWTRLSPRSAAGTAIITPATGGGTTHPPTETSVRGIWLLEGSGQLLRFGRDGTYAIDDGGLLGADPDDIGTYEVEGSSIAFTSTGSRSCAAGESMVWEKVVRDDVFVEENRRYVPRLRTGAIETECPSFGGGDQTWIRVSA